MSEQATRRGRRVNIYVPGALIEAWEAVPERMRSQIAVAAVAEYGKQQPEKLAEIARLQAQLDAAVAELKAEA